MGRIYKTRAIKSVNRMINMKLININEIIT